MPRRLLALPEPSTESITQERSCTGRQAGASVCAHYLCWPMDGSAAWENLRRGKIWERLAGGDLARRLRVSKCTIGSEASGINRVYPS